MLKRHIMCMESTCITFTSAQAFFYFLNVRFFSFCLLYFLFPFLPQQFCHGVDVALHWSVLFLNADFSFKVGLLNTGTDTVSSRTASCESVVSPMGSMVFMAVSQITNHLSIHRFAGWTENAHQYNVFDSTPSQFRIEIWNERQLRSIEWFLVKGIPVTDTSNSSWQTLQMLLAAVSAEIW